PPAGRRPDPARDHPLGDGRRSGAPRSRGRARRGRAGRPRRPPGGRRGSADGPRPLPGPGRAHPGRDAGRAVPPEPPRWLAVNLPVELLLRIAVATALGAIIGLEREIHRRPAGLRTHMLVGLASSTFMVVSTHFVYFQHYQKEDLVTVDASRIAASVVAGTGFLAGGAIFRTGLTVQGLTTGAGLWLVSSIGLAAGGGMYPESFG